MDQQTMEGILLNSVNRIEDRVGNSRTRDINVIKVEILREMSQLRRRDDFQELEDDAFNLIRDSKYEMFGLKFCLVGAVHGDYAGLSFQQGDAFNEHAASIIYLFDSAADIEGSNRSQELQSIIANLPPEIKRPVLEVLKREVVVGISWGMTRPALSPSTVFQLDYSGGMTESQRNSVDHLLAMDKKRQYSQDEQDYYGALYNDLPAKLQKSVAFALGLPYVEPQITIEQGNVEEGNIGEEINVPEEIPVQPLFGDDGRLNQHDKGLSRGAKIGLAAGASGLVGGLVLAAPVVMANFGQQLGIPAGVSDIGSRMVSGLVGAVKNIAPESLEPVITAISSSVLGQFATVAVGAGVIAGVTAIAAALMTKSAERSI